MAAIMATLVNMVTVVNTMAMIVDMATVEETVTGVNGERGSLRISAGSWPHERPER